MIMSIAPGYFDSFTDDSPTNPNLWENLCGGELSRETYVSLCFWFWFRVVLLAYSNYAFNFAIVPVMPDPPLHLNLIIMLGRICLTILGSSSVPLLFPYCLFPFLVPCSLVTP